MSLPASRPTVARNVAATAAGETSRAIDGGESVGDNSRRTASGLRLFSADWREFRPVSFVQRAGLHVNSSTCVQVVKGRFAASVVVNRARGGTP